MSDVEKPSAEKDETVTVTAEPQEAPAVAEEGTPPSTPAAPASPAIPATPEVEPAKAPTNTAGIVILQWLTYAFWGWLVASLAWLTAVTFSSLITGEPASDSTPYAIAASLVLLPIAGLCDFFYRKYEPVKKIGITMVIMVIHAVIFALIGIGALISAAFTVVNSSISTSGLTDANQVVALTSLTTAILYGATFLRTLNPFKTKRPSFIYSLSVILFTILLGIMAVAGPLANSYTSRDDRRIDQALPAVNSAITEYTSQNDKLPESLTVLTFNDYNTIAEDVVAEGLISYKPEGKVEDPGTKIYASPNINPSRNTPIRYRYQLCVNYKTDTLKKSSTSKQSFSSNTDTYRAFLSVRPHKVGETCYKLEATSYLNDSYYKYDY